MKETEQVNQEVLRNVANENSDACTHTHTHTESPLTIVKQG